VTRPLARFASCTWLAWFTLTEPAVAQPPIEPQRDNAADFRLRWLFGDDDVLHAPDATRPPSPASAIGDRAGYDPLLRELGGRFTGRENRAEFRALLSAPAFVPGLTTRAQLSLGADLETTADTRSDAPPFVDLGSYVEFEQRLSTASRLALRLYPLDGDEERVGELDALAFGGAVGARRDSPYQSATRAPRAARFRFQSAGVSAFLGLKTAPFVEALPVGVAVEETSYGVLAGVVSDIGAHVRLGVSGGYFEHGRLSLGELRGPRATTSGVAFRAAFGVGMREPPRLAELGPEASALDAGFDAPPEGLALGAEWVELAMRRGRFERPDEVRLMPARGGALSGAIRVAWFELRAAALYRDAELVMRNANGVFPGLTLPLASATQPELSLIVLPRIRPHPAVALGLGVAAQSPAAIMSFAFDRLGQPTGGALVIRRPSDLDLLPAGQGPVAVFEVRPSLAVRLSSVLGMSAWVSYRRDYNRVRSLTDFQGVAARGFADPNFFGYGVALSGGR
jgi:hypothetical protein